MKKLILKSAAIFCFLVIVLWPVTWAEAFYSSSPLQSYERGQQLIQSYRGDPRHLQEAAFYFNLITEKHPESPLGYLGMSQIKLIEAYRGGNHYNMKMIQEEALPLALNAMRAGPTLLIVQNNYDRFEEVISHSEKVQDHIRRQLVAAPEKSQTYFDLAEYLIDQSDYQKSIEFFLLTINSTQDESLKLKSLERMGWIYLTQLKDPTQAIKVYKMALEIKEDLLSVKANLGQAYFDINDYDKSIAYLKAASRIFSTPEMESKLYQAEAMKDESQGRLKEAIYKFQKAMTISLSDPLIHYRLGNLYYRQNDFALAYEQYIKVIGFGVANPKAYYFAGRAAYSIGKSEDAREYCSRYLQFQTEGQEADWIRAQFPELSQR